MQYGNHQTVANKAACLFCLIPPPLPTEGKLKFLAKLEKLEVGPQPLVSCSWGSEVPYPSPGQPLLCSGIVCVTMALGTQPPACPSTPIAP